MNCDLELQDLEDKIFEEARQANQSAAEQEQDLISIIDDHLLEDYSELVSEFRIRESRDKMQNIDGVVDEDEMTTASFETSSFSQPLCLGKRERTDSASTLDESPTKAFSKKEGFCSQRDNHDIDGRGAPTTVLNKTESTQICEKVTQEDLQSQTPKKK